jgi:hypothetical protein
VVRLLKIASSAWEGVENPKVEGTLGRVCILRSSCTPPFSTNRLHAHPYNKVCGHNRIRQIMRRFAL